MTETETTKKEVGAMKFPSIDAIAAELRHINGRVKLLYKEEHCDVRLQVYEDGSYAVRVGDPSYDTDHLGYWGASSVPGVFKGVVRRFSSKDIARDLLEQVKDEYEEDKF